MRPVYTAEPLHLSYLLVANGELGADAGAPKEAKRLLISVTVVVVVAAAVVGRCCYRCCCCRCFSAAVNR